MSSEVTEVIMRLRMENAEFDRQVANVDNAFQRLRATELSISRGLSMIEAPLRIAERFGVKIDKDIKDAINTAQLLIQTMRVATMWAHNLKAALIGTGIGIVMVAIGGLVSSRMTTNEDRRIER